jgi:hypothetical protein
VRCPLCVLSVQQATRLVLMLFWRTSKLAALTHVPQALFSAPRMAGRVCGICIRAATLRPLQNSACPYNATCLELVEHYSAHVVYGFRVLHANVP